MRFNTIVYSYLFFALFVFNALALLSAEFMPIFSQLFTLLAEDGRIYDIFSCILLFIVLLTLFSMPIRMYKQRQTLGKTAPFIVSFMACILLCIVCVLLYWLSGKIFQQDVRDLLLGEEVVTQTWQSYYTSLEFFFSFICWFLFVILPLAYKAVSLEINIQHRIGKSMLILEPSITTIVIFMSANVYHPYFSNLASKYIYFAYFVLANIMLLYVLFRNKKLFGFYEYANLVLLSLNIFYVVLCSSSMLRGDFFNAQLTLYALGIASWCSEWLYNQEIVSEQITS
ncbi:hypothetical protein [Helicobacter trogontum]|uniref:Uncharacterized protein n=1 Tax=Helicobacter trogontum TaxID=50960 RepID=A0ABQ0D3J5_9HELI|nr:hypothetical protein [Helicobacter trogontum]